MEEFTDFSAMDSFFNQWKYSRQSIEELYFVIEESNHFCYFMPIYTHFSFKYFTMKNMDDSLDKYYTYLIIKYFTLNENEKQFLNSQIEFKNLESIFSYYTNDSIREYFHPDQIHQLPFESNYIKLFHHIDKNLVLKIIEKANTNIIVNIIIKMIYCITDECNTNVNNFLQDFIIRSNFSNQIFKQIFESKYDSKYNKDTFTFEKIFDLFNDLFTANNGIEFCKLIKNCLDFIKFDYEKNICSLEQFTQRKMFWDINSKTDNEFFNREYQLILKYKLFYENYLNMQRYQNEFWNEDFCLLNSVIWSDFMDFTATLLHKIPFDTYTVHKMLSVYHNLFL
jgi:hypothetical protein